MNIDEIREQLTKACDAAIARGMRIRHGTLGVHALRAHATGDCCCPIGALQLMLNMSLLELEGQFDFNAFIYGFDSDVHYTLAEWFYEGEPGLSALRNLGIEFRKKYDPIQDGVPR